MENANIDIIEDSDEPAFEDLEDIEEEIKLEDLENIEGAITFDNIDGKEDDSGVTPKISGAAIPLGSIFNMFQNNNALKVVYVSNKWNMDSVTNKTDMFTNSGVTDVTKSDTCMEDAIKDLVELSISTTKTSNSIKAVANVFYASSGVKTYEYSIDGVNYITSDTNVYTFNNLESNKTYKVYVKVTTNNGGSAESSAEVTTDSLSPATFKEVNDKVLINYPTTTGLYKTGDSEYKEGNMTSDSGVVIAKVTDGIKTVYSSYNR